MKPKKINLFIAIAVAAQVVSSCKTHGAGGTDSGLTLAPDIKVETDYNLLPAGSRITHTIDGSTAEGKQKLRWLSLQEAKVLAENEAAVLYDCDRLIDPRFTYTKKGKKIKSITVAGRPGVYKEKTLPQVIQDTPETPNNNPAVVYHVVQEGETLAKIAKTYKVTVGQICTWNNLTNTKVAPGKKLILQVK